MSRGKELTLKGRRQNRGGGLIYQTERNITKQASRSIAEEQETEGSMGRGKGGKYEF